MQNFTTHMPLLAATSAFGFGRRHWSSPQQCYLQRLHTFSAHLQITETAIQFEVDFYAAISKKTMSSFQHIFYLFYSAVFLLFARQRALRFRSPLLLAFFLLSGDIELNPGPANFTLCTLNIRSILHPLHSAALSDLIDTHNPDLLCLTQTWIKPTTTAAELLNCTPPPRKGSNKILSSGGGTAFLVREPFTQLSTSVPDFSSFESSSVTLQLSHSNLSVFNIYRPPSSSTYSKPFSVFLDDFSSFHSFAATTPHEFIITGYPCTTKVTFLI